MNPTKYLVKFRLNNDPPNIAYRTLTFVWKLRFSAARSRILDIISKRYGPYSQAKVYAVFSNYLFMIGDGIEVTSLARDAIKIEE